MYRRCTYPLVLLLYVFLILEILFAVECVTDDLETECSQTSDSLKSESAPSLIPFRTDGLTRAEFCLSFAKQTSCIQATFGLTYKMDNCNNATDSEVWAHPCKALFNKTYIDLSCPTKECEDMKTITTSINMISPTRAIALKLYDNTDDRWLAIHKDITAPVRNQVIQLSVFFCKSPNTTVKVYALGMLPNVLHFQLGWFCHGLRIRKADFSRMPQVRVIQFTMSTTIAEMEPYTFTDLSNLQILTLEGEIAGNLFSRAENDHSEARSSLPDHVFEHIRRLHCACSFAWFRNFLKKKPHLTAAIRKGQLLKVGSFVLPEDDIRAPGSSANLTALSRRELDSFSISIEIFQNKWSPVLSVNCDEELNWENTQAGDLFSYNTSCYNLNC
ncbi:uncharacterized protein LOC129595874 [Paramacrobiotus metropolitanus]|uniref:uncharacterized protein LOC129595874 n=1 Tax=Paramacrobiotus metropolitanus TaxID=2943436 RepID=UPI002445FAB8|nr:uncharacterized protein LOC129595874 [Paramacrobiotus metropolitanus]